MTQEEYLNIVYSIKEELSDANANEIIKKLNDIMNVKPVRLPWFVAMAEAELKAGKNIGEIFKFLQEKGWYFYNYCGIESMADLYSRMNMSYGDISDAARNKIMPWLCIPDLKEKHANELEEVFSTLKQRSRDFLGDVLSDSNLLELQDSYFRTSNYVSYSLVAYLLEKREIKFVPCNFIKSAANFGYLRERVSGIGNDTFIVVMTINSEMDCEVAAKILALMGKDVYLITAPIECFVNNPINLKDTVSICWENMQIEDGIKVINSLEIILDSVSLGNNIADIISFISKNYSENELATVLCTGELMDILCKEPILRKSMERLDNLIAEGLEKNLSFAWSGNYLSYISSIYEFDTEAAIVQPAQYDFSIVIPARNSVGYLQHTLKSCLAVKYSGSYEIVISDNSTTGNNDVYNLVCELDDKRINYYRPPRVLNLPKSFEYAFLKAKGEFIFSIGSDDGILPWSLDVIKDALECYPEDEVFSWDRAFYAWPGFNGGQQNQFIIPRDYKKDEVKIEERDCKDILAGIIKDSSFMYMMPMLYINSGFRRSYFRTLLENTGRLWDGICQDLYMGVVTLSIKNKIQHIQYPLAIAGMTSSSQGKKSNEGCQNVAEASKIMDEAKIIHNLGGFSKSQTERLLPELRSDISSLYNSILRVIARGVLPEIYLERILNWKKMFLDCVSLMRKDDVMYDKNVHYARYTASKHGKEFLCWFDDKIYPVLMKPEVYENNGQFQETKRTYEVGIQKDGRCVLDASEYGAKNIYDAVLLLQRITGLGSE